MLREAFGHSATRELLWAILGFCDVYKANGGDSEYRVGINEGKRRVGLFIESLLSVIDEKKIVDWKYEMRRQGEREDEIVKEEVRKGRFLDE